MLAQRAEEKLKICMNWYNKPTKQEGSGVDKRILGTVAAIIIIVAAVVAVIALTGNDKSATPTKDTTNNSSNTQQSTQAEATDSVTIKDFAFSPVAITVKVGTKVTWTNQDAVGHTVTVDSGSGPDSPLLDQGQSYSYTFSKAGTYTYHCTPHPYMKGTVIVTE